ncbi:hypothetical protein GCM10028805_17220 [Spirosoma harenae]
MKQFILIGVLMGLLTATIPIRAQVALRDSDARKGSRLEIGRTSSPQKSSSTRLPTQRFSMVPNPNASGLDRSITINKNSAISEHYRSVLLPGANAKSTTRTASTETSSVANNEVRSAPAQEGKNENKLFANDKLWISNAYPNPADDVAEFDYQFLGTGSEAKLALLNILGTPVAGYEQIELEKSDRKVRIVTRPLDTGYYLYQLTVDGKKVATKRLLVRHQ